MNIAIEISPQLGGKRGIGNYTENLIKWLAAVDNENRYTIFSWFFREYNKKLGMIYCPGSKNFSLYASRFPERLLNLLEWDRGIPVIDFLLKGRKIAVYHSPGPRLPKLKKIKTIITLHDLMYELHPEWVDTRFIKANREAVKRADIIVTDVNQTKTDIIDIYGIESGKIAVVHLGVDSEVFRKINDKNLFFEVRKRYNLPEDFIFDVGPFEPRRNTENLLKAYAVVKEKYPKLGLVLVGSLTSAIKNKISELRLEGDVVSTGYIPMKDLIALYNLAKIFVHPELYIGYSLQVHEAMACECPVIASNNSCFPELIGDAGILVDPCKYEDIAAAVVRLMDDENLRSGLIEKGKLRIKDFTWESTAVKMKEIYEKFA
ncbi:MAG: D-inositol 3-phosphate glycosyltransferase [Elusimicrobia bacterium ADurb.Bin231]|nr:MAG: D-inositol 3-phosphate glycosyltransferase [Elusimicrobia bacterium ADurb.Bin231]